MQVASVPPNEELRLDELYSYDILDSDSEKEFDELLEVAAQVYGCPIAAIIFIDKERQWLKAKLGVDISETSRDLAFCAHTILQGEPLIIEDASIDKRFCGNPFVTEGLAIRFYAGAPIISKAGYKLGAICVLDQKPRELLPEQTRTLTILSGQISKLLELRLKNRQLKQRAEEQLQLEKQLLHQTLLRHETEKVSIGNELHENIAQGLSATKFYLELAEDGGLVKDELIRKSKDNIVKIIKQVISLSQSIAASTLKDISLKDLLTEQLSYFYNKTGIVARLIYKGHVDIDPSVVTLVYQIVEEHLKNVHQHSSATEVAVNVDAFSSLSFCINDNGIGIRNQFKKGVGIHKIQSKVDRVNGSIDITKDAKGGCKLSVTIPITVVEPDSKCKFIGLNRLQNKEL